MFSEASAFNPSSIVCWEVIVATKHWFPPLSKNPFTAYDKKPVMEFPNAVSNSAKLPIATAAFDPAEAIPINPATLVGTPTIGGDGGDMLLSYNRLTPPRDFVRDLACGLRDPDVSEF